MVYDMKLIWNRYSVDIFLNKNMYMHVLDPGYIVTALDVNTKWFDEL